MTKRKHQLLTESERDQILAIPTDRDRLARLYSFEPSDMEIIGARRERGGSVAKIVKLEHAWRRLDGRNDDGFQVAPFPG